MMQLQFKQIQMIRFIKKEIKFTYCILDIFVFIIIICPLLINTQIYNLFMIFPPNCNISQRSSTTLCLFQNCETSAFVCKYCPKRQCEERHRHDKAEIVRWTEISPLLQSVRYKKKQERDRLEKQLNKQIKSLFQQLAQLQANHMEYIQKLYSGLKMKDHINDFMMKLKDQNMCALTGREMKILYQTIKNKNHFKNEQDAETLVESENQKFKSLLQQLKLLIKNYALANQIIFKQNSKKYVRSINLTENGYSKGKYILNKAVKSIETNPEIQQYNKIIFSRSDNYVSYLNRGILYKRENKIQEALNDFNRAIHQNNMYCDAYNHRGNLYLELDKNNEAMSDFTKVLELDPYNFQAHFNRGNLFYKLRKFQDAMKDYTKAINIDPDRCSKVFNHRGLANKILGNNQQAELDYNSAIALDPQYAAAYNNRGLLYFNQKRYDQAESDYDQAIQLNPNNKTYYENRIILYRKLNRISEAMQDEATVQQLQKI